MMKLLKNIINFHLIFVQLVDSRFGHLDDKAELIDDKNDDGNEADADTQDLDTLKEDDQKFCQIIFYEIN